MIIFLVKILCYTAVLFAFLHTLIGYLLLWVDQRPWRVANPAPSEHGTQDMQWLRQAVLEFLYQLLQILSYPLAFFQRPSPITVSESPHTPVLFIHGYLSHRLMWSWLIYHLKKKSDVGPLYSLNLWPPLASIQSLAAHVERKVRAIQNETGATQVIVVGHSMGGLVASAMSEYLAQPQSIAKVITLGTPFQGTALAALGMGENALEMLPGSTFLEALAQRLASSTTSYYCIASHMDQEIIPWNAALHPMDIPDQHLLILENQGHLGLLFSKTVLEQLYQWLRS